MVLHLVSESLPARHEFDVLLCLKQEPRRRLLPGLCICLVYGKR